MCVVSMIGDHYHDKWDPQDWYKKLQEVNVPKLTQEFTVTHLGITREEFDELKKEVLEMKELLKKAIKYDKDNNEPDCHIDEKLETLRKVAEAMDVDLNDILKPKK